MRKINAKFQTKFISEEGSKLLNKDYFAFVELDKLACYVLVDGIDEDREKQSSQLVAESIIRSFTEKPTFKKSRLRQYVALAHRTLQAESGHFHLKAAVTVIVTDYVKLRYVQVGNTRFQLVRNGRVLVHSEDQSLAQIKVNEIQGVQDKIAAHEERHNLYTYLGQDGFVKPFISKKVKLQDGDLWLLITRGIWEYCTEGEMLDATDEAKNPQEVIDNIEELVLAKQPEEIDNYTIAVTFVDKVYQNPKKKITVKRVIMTIIPIALIGSVLGVTFYMKAKNKRDKIQQMNEYILSAEKYVANENYIKANEEYGQALTLAKKLKDAEEKETLDHYQKLLAQVILADEKMDSGDYYEAQTAYLIAQTLCPAADAIGKSYIEKKLAKSQDYIDVLDFLQEGDKQLDYGEVDLAREAYQKAKTLANENYFQEGKKEAIEKIDKIDAQKAEEKKAEKEEAEKEVATQKEEAAQKEAAQKAEQEQKAQEETAAQAAATQLLEAKLSALEIEKKGNASYKAGSYEDAIMYYLMAQDLYKEVGLTTKVDDLYEKITIIDKLLVDHATTKSKAQVYEETADEKAATQFYEEAKMLYILAKGIYEEAGFEDDVAKVDEKIVQIEAILMSKN